MTEEYLKTRHRQFAATASDQALFEQTTQLASSDRATILANVNELSGRRGLAYGLLALYRQQVDSGFVLADPLGAEGKEQKVFEDPSCDVSFQLLWNPDRELRKNHALLIERGVIAKDVDKTQLVNKDAGGRPCYLCKENIALQNPGEVLFPVQLAGEEYNLGANFAYISNNHFTLMCSEHRPQAYARHVLDVLCDFVDQTAGHFRGIYNGMAGASIPWHEHLQVTDVPFPVEQIRIAPHDVVRDDGTVRVSRPFYYTSAWVIEGAEPGCVCEAADRVITEWHRLNEEHHTENVIAAKTDGKIRIFVFPRDTRRLGGQGKFGDMASFECGGSIVLSYAPPEDKPEDTNERQTFEAANLSTVVRLLGDIAPIIPDPDTV